MINIEKTFKDIMTLYQAVSNKGDCEVSMTYRGTGYGVSKPWLCRIDGHDQSHENFEGALNEMLAELKQELADRVLSTEKEATRLRQTLSRMDN